MLCGQSGQPSSLSETENGNQYNLYLELKEKATIRTTFILTGMENGNQDDLHHQLKQKMVTRTALLMK